MNSAFLNPSHGSWEVLFPALGQTVNGKRLVYLDGAASKLVPAPVAQAVHQYQIKDHSNVHRGVHMLSERVSAMWESARSRVARFIGASTQNEVVFTSGATHALNLVAYGLARSIGPGDVVLVSGLEHHANLVPWQVLCANRGAILKTVPIEDDGTLSFDVYQAMLGPKVKVVALAHVSNTLGTLVPVKEFVKAAKAYGAVAVVDGAQAVSHIDVDVSELGCDFYAFSGHKMYSPTGIGVLFGRAQALESLAPLMYGGGMVDEVSDQCSSYAALPSRLEGGTPNISGAIGLAAAIDFLESVGWRELALTQHDLMRNLLEGLREIAGVQVLGDGGNKVSCVSFSVEGVHPHDVGTVLDQGGVAVRVGHHCAQSVMRRYNVAASVRASTSIHNTGEDVNALLNAVRGIRRYVQ